MSSDDAPKFLSSECFACLRLSKRCIPIFLDANKDDDQEPKMIVIELLGRHFWFQESDFSVEKVLCDNCWRRLNEFERFYSEVQDLKRARGTVAIGSCHTCTRRAEECESMRSGSSGEGSAELLEMLDLHFEPGSFGSEFSMCGTCWNRLNEFHRFYREVEESHSKRLEEIQCEEAMGSEECEGDSQDAGNQSEDSTPFNASKELRPEPLANSEATAIIRSHIQYVCRVCQKHQKTFKSLKTHMGTHGMKQCVTCCGIEFFFRSNLLRHVLKVQTLNLPDPTNIQCERCHFKFASEYQLELHMQGHANKDKEKFKCTECDASYGNKTRFTQHMQIKHGVGKFHCDICGRGFNGKGSLERHKQKHLQPPKETLYRCEFCPKMFLNPHRRGSHRQIHSGPKECEVCGETLMNAAVLARHKREVHVLNGTPGDCDICGKRCENELVLHRHRNGHNATAEV